MQLFEYNESFYGRDMSSASFSIYAPIKCTMLSKNEALHRTHTKKTEKKNEREGEREIEGGRKKEKVRKRDRTIKQLKEIQQEVLFIK